MPPLKTVGNIGYGTSLPAAAPPGLMPSPAAGSLSRPLLASPLLELSAGCRLSASMPAPPLVEEDELGKPGATLPTPAVTTEREPIGSAAAAGA